MKGIAGWACLAIFGVWDSCHLSRLLDELHGVTTTINGSICLPDAGFYFGVLSFPSYKGPLFGTEEKKPTRTVLLELESDTP